LSALHCSKSATHALTLANNVEMDMHAISASTVPVQLRSLAEHVFELYDILWNFSDLRHGWIIGRAGCIINR
jgi:hypothetical protein